MSVTKILANTLFDGTGKITKDAVILVEDKKIKEVGVKAALGAAPADKTLEYNFVMPGLIDCHNHVTVTMGNGPRPEGKDVSPIVNAMRGVENVAKDLFCGVTTMRTLGEPNRIDMACKDEIENGWIPGPRLICAGQSVRSTHGHGMLAIAADGTDQVRIAARNNIKAGAAVLKLLTTGLIGTPGHIKSDYSKEEIEAFVDEAKRAELPSTVHCIGGIGLKWCVEAGMESIEHGFFVDDENIETLLKYDCWLDMTPGPFFIDERVNASPKKTAEGMVANREIMRECQIKAIKAGVKFSIGTDSYHGNFSRELEIFTKQFGCPNEQVLKAATLNGAKVCRVDDITGTIEAGKYADIIACAGDPLANIRDLDNLLLVMKEGKIYIDK